MPLTNSSRAYSCRCLLIAAVSVCWAVPVAAQDNTGEAAPVNASPRIEWDRGGPILYSAAERFWFKPLAQIVFDASTTAGSSTADNNLTKTGARALHIGFAGGTSGGFGYQLETELAGGDVNILWAYLGWRGKAGPLDADVLLGNFQNDRGVEGASGGEALPLIEPNFIASSIGPARGDFGLGVQGRLIGKRWHASLAITGDDIDDSRPASDRRVVQGRAHWNPLRGDTATLHLGAWGYDERLSGADRALGSATRIAHGLNPVVTVASAALLNARGDRGYGVEFGGTAGRFWVMAEAARRDIRLPASVRERQDAVSIAGGLFLTATPAYYDGRTGTFGRPRPAHPVFDGGPGAVEVTARYEEIDLGTNAGSGQSTTLGVNWYLNDFARLMLNGARWSRTPFGAAAPDHGTTVAARAQIAF